MRNHKSVKYFKLDVKGKLITVYIAEDSISRIAAEFGLVGFMAPKEGVIRTMLRYSPEMRFELVDQDRRLFSVDRFCYRGSVDDWMQISVARPLAEQAAKFLPHLGKESFYELY